MVERIAKRTGGEEADVAREPRSSSAAAAADGRRAIRAGATSASTWSDRGLAELERTTGYRPPPGEALHRWALRHPNVVFVGGILVGTAVAARGGALAGRARTRGPPGWSCCWSR